MTDSEQIWKEYHDSLDNRNKLKDDLAASEIRFKKALLAVTKLSFVYLEKGENLDVKA